MATGTATPTRRFRPALREDERVSPLELFFDLVFVLTLTQCTVLMADNPTWEGVGQAMLVLALLWWSWGGYTWLTGVLDPEDDAVRISIFASMAAFLVAALAVPDAFGDQALEFALAYGAVRIAHIVLFVIASRDDPALRQSVAGLAGGTAVGVGLLIVGALVGGSGQTVIWIIALVLDLAEPYFFFAEGWRLVPGHFAERFGLIIIIALGESIVAIGTGVGDTDLTAGVIAAAILGVGLAAAMWWLYFDVVALVAARRLAEAPEGRVRNEMARDSYGYLHFLFIAGIVLVALGLKKILGDVDDPLKTVPAFALLGGVAVYLLGHVAFRYRNIHTINRQRLLLLIVLLALIPLAREVSPLVVLALVDLLLMGLIAYETIAYGERRAQVRRQLAAEPPPT
jgi:low temperature requirement protein LtrA